MIRKIKKGFTLIELVVVIAVIAILVAVSVVSYLSITNKAKESNDHMVIDQVNTTLLGSSILNKKSTVHEIVEDLDEDEGFDIRQIKPELKDTKFVYSYEKGKFGYWKEKDKKVVYPSDLAEIDFTNSNDLWFFEDEAKATYDDSYSHYLKSAGSVISVETNGGLDVGNCETISSITLSRTSKAKKDVVIRSKGGTLVVSAPSDTVKHYGEADLIDIQKVASASYHENGTVSLVKVANGRVALESESNVGAIHLAVTNGEFDDITVAKASNIEMPDFSRDPVEIPTAGKKVVALQEGTADANAKKDYVWLTAVGVYEQVTIGTSSAAGTNYAATSESATQEQKTTAQQIANNITASYNEKEYEVKAVKNGDDWEYQLVSETEEDITSEVSVEVSVTNNVANASVFVGETEASATTSNSTVITQDNIDEIIAHGASKTFAEIDSKEKLVAFRDEWNAGKIEAGTFKLTTNIDISDKPWEAIGTWKNPFHGTFDGNGKTITGLNVNNQNTSGEIFTTDTVKSTGVVYGFIGLVGNGDVTVKDLTLKNVDIDIPNLGNCVGGIIGYASSTSDFSSSSKGGLYGGTGNKASANVTITGCTVEGATEKSISIKDCAGGIMGKAYNTGTLIIKDCTTNIEVKANNGRAAGICGYVSGPTGVNVTGNTIKKDVYAAKTVVDKVAAFTFIGKDYVYDNNTTTGMKAYFKLNDEYVEQEECYSLTYVYENGIPQSVTFSNDLSKTKYGDDSSAGVANFEDGTILNDVTARKDYSFKGNIVVNNLDTNGNTININSGTTTINAGTFNQVALKNTSNLIVNGGTFVEGKHIISSTNGTVTLNSISNTSVLNYENAGTFYINCTGDFTVYSYLNDSHETTSHSFSSDDGKCHYVINENLSFTISDSPETVGTYRHIIITDGE